MSARRPNGPVGGAVLTLPTTGGAKAPVDGNAFKSTLSHHLSSAHL
jgi:hypothetical protein